MCSKNSKTSSVNRRKFLSMANYAATAGLTVGPIWISKSNAHAFSAQNATGSNAERHKIKSNGQKFKPAIDDRFVAIDNVCAWPNLTVLEDGKIVTAYYASGVEAHRRYHMGTAIWDPDLVGKSISE